jgi:four helix bundle protein
MKCDRFEDVPVWQSAMDLAVKMYALTDDRGFHGPGDLRDQLRRAALSISNNIAEGFERGTTPELLNFLYIARGSAGEVRSMLLFCERRSQTAHLKSQISDLVALAESCSRQLRAWANSVQNSGIRGQRHLNDQTRLAYESKRRAEAFLKQVDEVVRRRSGSRPNAEDPQSPPDAAGPPTR